MSEQSIRWDFEILKPGCRKRNLVSEEFFTNDTRLEAVIRESIQNGELEVEIQVGKNGEKILIDQRTFKESAA